MCKRTEEDKGGQTDPPCPEEDREYLQEDRGRVVEHRLEVRGGLSGARRRACQGRPVTGTARVQRVNSQQVASGGRQGGRESSPAPESGTGGRLQGPHQPQRPRADLFHFRYQLIACFRRLVVL